LTERCTKVPPAFKPESIRAIIFDLDGTLVDSYEAITESANHALDQLGLPRKTAGEVRRLVGHGLEALLASIVGEARAEEATRLFRIRYEQVFAEMTTILPGVADTLQRLADRGYRMAVASNKPARFTEPILGRLNLLTFFQSIQGPDRAGTTKPEPTMLHNCLDELRVSADSCVYVGDMVLDVETAATAGISVILVSGGSSSSLELEATGQLHLSDFRELAGVLQ
jgi:phosphoglycolate phosphatase